ncbi:MAG: DUF4442 domain-containing protein [Flavobacteriaceae bacterium]|nr:DUF4442 domain-containing protein [Flavobacteriaceae bacterium]
MSKNSLSPQKVNFFLFFKLPSAWWCGVRLSKLSATTAVSTVTHKWLNQNPFKSMYFAVQAMAAELTTGALVMQEIQSSGEKISMLVLENESFFHKKATGKIRFECLQGEEVRQAINQSIQTGEGVKLNLKSSGFNENNELVSHFQFVWTIKLKK